MVAQSEMALLLLSRTSTNDPKLRILKVCIYIEHTYKGFVSHLSGTFVVVKQAMRYA
jgi:hypothetical protein